MDTYCKDAMKKQVFSLFHAYLFLSNMKYLGRVSQKTSQLGENTAALRKMVCQRSSANRVM